jgi:hypothetical protein
MTSTRRIPWLRSVVFLGLTLAVASVLLLPPGGPATAQTPASGATIVRVEEDWSLSVNQPDGGLAAPQVSTQMARNLWTSRFCNFHLNSTDLPAFAIGGLQLQSWNGNQNLNVLTGTNGSIMSTPNELVTWTQYLRVANGNLYFGIGTLQPGVPGSSSTTWGDFSGMEIQVPGAWTDLSNYDRSYSENNSGITFGANRVDSFTQVAVRYYYSDGTVVTDSNSHVVYSSQINGLGSGDN